MERKVLYCGIKLDEKSRNILAEMNPEGMKVFCDHMTCEFAPSDGSEVLGWVKNNLGKKFTLKPIALGVDINERGYIYALKVECEAPSRNAIKHVTMATTGTRKPVESNYIEDWFDCGPETNWVLTGEPHIWYK